MWWLLVAPFFSPSWRALNCWRSWFTYFSLSHTVLLLLSFNPLQSTSIFFFVSALCSQIFLSSISVFQRLFFTLSCTLYAQHSVSISCITYRNCFVAPFSLNLFIFSFFHFVIYDYLLFAFGHVSNTFIFNSHFFCGVVSRRQTYALMNRSYFIWSAPSNP